MVDKIILVQLLAEIHKLRFLKMMGVTQEVDYILYRIIVDAIYVSKGLNRNIYSIALTILNYYPDIVLNVKLNSRGVPILTERIHAEIIEAMFKSSIHVCFQSYYDLKLISFVTNEIIITNLGQSDHKFFVQIINYMYEVSSNEQVILDIADAISHLYGDILTEGCINVKDVFKYILDNSKVY